MCFLQGDIHAHEEETTCDQQIQKGSPPFVCSNPRFFTSTMESPFFLDFISQRAMRNYS